MNAESPPCSADHSVIRRTYQTLPMVGLVYGIHLAGAVVPTVTAAFFEDLRTLTVLKGFEVLDAARDGAQAAIASLVAFATVAAVFFLVSPWLTASWLAFASEPRKVAESLVIGLRRTPATYGVTTLIIVVFLVVCGVGTACAGFTYTTVADHPNALHADLAVAAALAPMLFLLPFVGVWHDLARASVVHGHGSWRALRYGFRSINVSLLLAYLLAGFVGLTLSTVTIALAWLASGPWVVLLSQPCILARTLVRSAWLVRAADSQRRSSSA